MTDRVTNLILIMSIKQFNQHDSNLRQSLPSPYTLVLSKEYTQNAIIIIIIRVCYCICNHFGRVFPLRIKDKKGANLSIVTSSSF